MAPRKSALLESFPATEPPPIIRHPLTTQEKLQNANARAARKNKHPPMEAPSTKKGRTLPPPGELTAEEEHREAKQQQKKIKSGLGLGGSGLPKTPMTTMEKQRAAKSKKRALDHCGESMKDAEVEGGTGGGKKRKMPKPKMTDVLMEHKNTSVNFAPKKPKDGEHLAVMLRRTKKAERLLGWKRSVALNSAEGKRLWNGPEVRGLLSSFKGSVLFALTAAREDPDVRDRLHELVKLDLLPDPGKLELTAYDLLSAYSGAQLEKQRKEVIFRFMDLPEEVRSRICSHAFVDDKIFVRPDNGGTGREQPDLAMVSKRIREKVLPVFYSKNVFAIQLPLQRTTTKPKAAWRTDLDGKKSLSTRPWLTDAECWSSAIDADPDPFIERFESEGWFKDIRHFVLDCSDVELKEPLLLSVKFGKESESRQWSAVVEVHREASCIMPGFEDHGSCRVKLTPEWVNELVIEVCENASRGYVAAGAICSVAKTLESRVMELVDHRCEVAA